MGYEDYSLQPQKTRQESWLKPIDPVSIAF